MLKHILKLFRVRLIGRWRFPQRHQSLLGRAVFLSLRRGRRILFARLALHFLCIFLWVVFVGLGIVAIVCQIDGLADEAGLGLHHLEECEVLVIRVLDSLPFNSELVAYLGQVSLTSVELLNGPFESLETEDQRCYIIEGPAGSCSSDDNFDSIGCCLVLVVLTDSAVLSLLPIIIGLVVSLSSLLVVFSFASFVGSFSTAHFQRKVNLFSDSVPDGVNAIPVVKSFEYSVATDHYEIKIILDFEAFNVWVAHDDIRITTEARTLCFNITESFRYWQTTWENTERTLNIKILLTRPLCCFCKCLSSVYFSSSCLNPDFFKFVIWLMVTRQHSNLRASINGHDCPGVTDIDDVDHIVNDHDNSGTRSRSLWIDCLSGHEVLGSCLSLFDQTQKVTFALSESLLNCFYWVLGKLLVLDNVIVQVVTQIVSAGWASMSIKNAEKANLRPLNIQILLVLGFQDI